MIVIGLDQGTTNSKAVAVDRHGRIISQASRPIATMSPEPGVVEQDPEAMIANAIACITEVMAKSGQSAPDIIGLGLANQTETLVVWHGKSGRPAMPAMVWQCRRGTDEIAELHKLGIEELIKERTGLDLDPTFTAVKLHWLCRHRPDIADGLQNGELLWGTVDSWLIWKLTGGAVYATDPSNASRTMLFDINRLAWDDDLADIFSLQLARRPECRRSNSGFGRTSTSVLGEELPIFAAMGDQQASLFGHGCFGQGQLKITYGTGAFLWMNAGAGASAPAANGIIRTIAWQIDEPCYAYEGFVIYAGKILDWLARHLAISGGPAGIAAEAEAARCNTGVALIPAFQGLASPWWEPAMRAAVFGMSEATTNGHIAHAGLEAVCFQIRAILDALSGNAVAQTSAIKIDGGMTRSHYFMEMQASVLGRSLSLAAGDHVTPYGAALMAGLGAGLWSSLGDLVRLIPNTKEIAPNGAMGDVLARNYSAWRSMIAMMIAQETTGKA